MKAFATLIIVFTVAGCTTQMAVRDPMLGFHMPDRALNVAVYSFYEAHGRWPSSVEEFPPSIIRPLRLEHYRILELETEPDGNLRITYEFADGGGEGWASLVPPKGAATTPTTGSGEGQGMFGE